MIQRRSSVPRVERTKSADPDAERQADGREPRHQQGVGRRPQALVDREGRAPEEPERKGDRASRRESRELRLPVAVRAQPLSRENAEKRRRDRRECREQAFRVPSGIAPPGVAAEDRAVDGGGEVPRDVQLARPEARHRNERHERPVHGEENRGRGEESAPAEEDVGQRGEEEADADPLEDPGDAHLRPVEEKEGERVQREAEAEDDGGAAQRVQEKPAAVRPFPEPA